MYTTRDDWTDDEFRSERAVHYRLYVAPRTNLAAVICVQDFDYPDYDARRILSRDGWQTEADAEQALGAMAPILAEAEQALPVSLDPDVRARMVAAAVRNRSTGATDAVDLAAIARLRVEVEQLRVDNARLHAEAEYRIRH